jgi:hypothetical protein
VIACTNPADPNSVCKASNGVQPAPGGGLIIRWFSVDGNIYSVHRTSNLALPFTAMAPYVPTSPPQNQFTGDTAIGHGFFFHRIKVAEYRPPNTRLCMPGITIRCGPISGRLIGISPSAIVSVNG